VIFPEAVVVYRIFGLNTSTIFALVRLVVTPFIVYLTLRIPFKRTYHWMFLIVSVVFLLYSGVSAYANSAPDAAAFNDRIWWIYWVGGRVQPLVIFQFVVYFVSRRVSLWRKLVLVGGYAYVVATVFVPLLIDPTFVFSKPALTATGFVSGPGTSDAYLRPNGIDIFVTAMCVLSFYLLIRHYRSEKSPLVRGQTLYLIVGLVLLFLGAYAVQIARYVGGPNFVNIFAGGGDFVLLLGLRKKGFYSVTPVAETATGTTAVMYPLEESCSYLSHDTNASFEAFTSLVRNGHEGLSITRIFPDRVRKDYGIQTTPIRWLAEAKGQDAIPPGDLLGLSLMVKDFLEKAKKPVVMLQGVEYLTTINGFGPTLRLIQGLSEANSEGRGILILPIVPKSLDEKEEALLESETVPMPPPTAS